MKPPIQRYDFEKVPTNDFVNAVIAEIEYDENHLFRGFATKDGKSIPDTIRCGARFTFEIEGCKFPHKSRWMKLVYSKKAPVFKKYIMPLVEGAREYMDWDLDNLKGMRIKMLWRDDGNFQDIDTVRPRDRALAYKENAQIYKGDVQILEQKAEAEISEEEIENEIPF